jgi:di/tricarboxylate transporter
MNVTIVVTTLLLMLAVLLWDRIRYDFVALAGLFVITITGVIPLQTAFNGFANPVVVTVASIMIISKGMQHCGLMDLVSRKLVWRSKTPAGLIFPLSVITGLVSAFMNNISIIMPISIKLARKQRHPVSLILMPLAFATLLGGMVTLVGSPPNIIISSVRAESVGSSFRLFDFFRVGAILAGIGIAYMSLIGWRFLPVKKTPASLQDTIEIEDYCTEVLVESLSPLAGQTVSQAGESHDIDLIALIRDGRILRDARGEELIREGDILLVEADSRTLKDFVEDARVVLVPKDKAKKTTGEDKDTILLEVVIMNDSLLIGKTAKQLNLSERYGITLLAIANKVRGAKQRLHSKVFAAGDVLLIQGNQDIIAEQLLELGCLALSERGYKIGEEKSIPAYLFFFGLGIALVWAGLLPVHIAFPLCALLMVLTGVIPYREVYQAVDWSVIVMLGALIPFGRAMTVSGAATAIGGALESISIITAPWFMVGILLLVTMILTNLVNNATTAIIMAPVAIGLASVQHGNADLYLMTVSIGSCSAFLTPIGHPSNTLVKAPGAYRFGDYWRLGLGVQLINLVVGTILLLHFWG